MKNKNYFKENKRSIIISAVVIISLSFLLYFFTSSHEPEFIITENVCQNKFIGEIVFNEHPNITSVENNEVIKLVGCVSGEGYDNKWFCQFEKEVCEEVEVDRLPECQGNYLCKDNPKCCLNYYIEDEPSEHILKYLDKYAECLEKCYNEDCSIGSNRCSLYKLGNYSIEVK